MSEERFVEVADEPRHRPLLENEFVRVFDFQLRPGETTLYHRHNEDTFCVAIEPASIVDQPFGEEPVAEPITWPAGIAWCRDYGSKPVIHRVTNSGGEVMRLIGAELRESPIPRSDHPLEAVAYELKYEDPRLRVYRLELAPGESTGVVAYDCSGLLVGVSPTCLSLRDGSRTWTQRIGSGDVHWLQGPMEVEVTNTGASGFRAYLAEWL